MKSSLKWQVTPMRLSSWLWLALSVLILSCSKKSRGEESTSGSAQNNVIQGTIYDAHGNKFHIDDATVSIHIYGMGNIGESDPLYNVLMDANSHYQIQVPNNTYAVHARAFFLLNGKRVAIDLKPLDGRPDNISLPSAPGIVRDFALQLTGPVPGGDPSTIQGYYGAKIWIGDGAYNFSSSGYWDNLASKYPGASLHFILTPISKLIDGTDAQIIELSGTTEEIKTGKWFVNIPYAVYKLSATLTPANAPPRAIRLSELPNISTAFSSINLGFPPESNDLFGRPSKVQVALWE